MRMNRLEPVFSELKRELPSILEQATEKQQAEPAPVQPTESIAKEKQIALARSLMVILGFDFDRGRLDQTAHPFTVSVPDDSRIASRYNESNALGGIIAIIHETGHSRYETGLRKAWRYKPVGRSMGMGVHESQSLFCEMQLGRSKAFINAIAPIVKEHLGEDPAFDAENMHRFFTHVSPGLVRVSADEVTYPLHVILRYEIERDLILGKAHVKDIPERWDTSMKDYLGLDTTGNFTDGPMQDVHWATGLFGYFPSYTLGAMNAAQLYHAMVQEIPDAQELVEKLEFSPIFDWLSRNIWQNGRFYDYDQLMVEATGETLRSGYFLDHIRMRYL